MIVPGVLRSEVSRMTTLHDNISFIEDALEDCD